MATLNDIEFGILKKTTSISHDNIITDIPGSDTVINNDLGYSTEPLVITGHVKNETEFDNFKEQYYSGGTLTLIVNPDSGKKLTVFALSNVTEIDGSRNYPLTDIIFNAVFHMETPYLESVAEITRSKSITTQNQEWSADNDSADISTLGNVDAVPDIQVVGGAYLTTNVSRETGDTPWTDINTSTYETSSSVYPSFVLKYTKTYPAAEGRAHHLTRVGADIQSSQTAVWGYTRVTVQAASFAGGVETTVADYSYNTDASWEPNSTTVDIQAGHNEDLVVKWYLSNISGYFSRAKNLDSDGENLRPVTTNGVQIYNTADSTVKSNVCNELEKGAIVQILPDGTGSFDYNEAFDDVDYLYAGYEYSGVTRDSVDHELDIADDGYIEYVFDTKYPINGTPTLLAQINITAGTPTIQISTDASTWYDLDTAIVDDVETSYPLDNDANLSLAGETLFYLRFDCVKAAAATCSIKSFELDLYIHTIYAKNPKVTKGGAASTFRCDQDADSAMACIVSLVFSHRWWA